MEEGHEEVKKTFEKFESDHPFDPQLAQLKIKYKNFDEKISSIGNKVIYALLDEVEKATEENLERAIKENVEKKENEGNNIEIKENNDNNKDNNENNENKNNKDDKDNKKGHEIIVTNFCCCCCNCNKDKNIVNENNKKEKKIEDKNEEYRKKKEECKEDVDVVKNKIEEDQKKYKEEILAKRVFCGCCGFCRCCCCKINNIEKEFHEFKDDLCYKMTRIQEEAMKLCRKTYLVRYLGNKFITSENPKCCKDCRCINDRRHCLVKFIWIIILIILIVLEMPGTNFQISLKYSFNNFIISFSIYFVISLFYFYIFVYSIIHHKYIQGDLLLNKNSEAYNYLKFILVVYNLFNASIYHSLWVLNKKGEIEAKFYDVFYLPKNNITIKDGDVSFKTSVLSLGTLLLILFFVFISSKFTELTIREKPIFVYNENTEFFFSDDDFYFYFLIGCACQIYIKRNQENFKNLDKEVENKESPIKDLTLPLMNEMNVENDENVDNVVNAENVDNVDNVVNVVNVENVENDENFNNVENVENVKNIENVEDVEII